MGRVEFLLGASALLLCFLSTIYISIFVIIICVPIALLLKILAIALLGFRFWRIMKLHIYRTTQNAIIRIWQDPQSNQWGCQSKSGHVAKGVLSGDSYQSRLFVIVQLRFRNRTQNVFIPFDALPAREYQYLRVRLKL